MKWIKILLSFGISAALVLWMLSSLDWSGVGDHVATMKWWPWLLAVSVTFSHFAFRAWRWSALFPGPMSSRSLMLLGDTMMIGNVASYLLPLRAGEIIRPAAYAKLSHTPFTAALTTVAVERLFDLSAVLLTLAWVLATVEGVPDIAQNAGKVLGILAGVMCFGVVLSAVKPEWVRTVSHAIIEKLPLPIANRLIPLVEHVLDGVSAIRSPSRLALIIAQTALVWGSCYLQFYLFLLPFNIPEASLLIGTTIAVMVALGVAAPSAPGFVGVFEVSCLMGFAIFGLDRELAAAYAITSHAFHYLCVIGYGTWALAKYNLKLAELRSPRMSANIP